VRRRTVKIAAVYPCVVHTIGGSRNATTLEPGRAALDDDGRLQVIVRVIDGLFRLAGTVVIALMIVRIGSYLRDVLLAFAGRETSATLAFSFLAKIQADRWLAYALGAGGVGYGLVERGLRRRNIKRLTERPGQLETRMHPSRTSSDLTPQGRTRREDR